MPSLLESKRGIGFDPLEVHGLTSRAADLLARRTRSRRWRRDRTPSRSTDRPRGRARAPGACWHRGHALKCGRPGQTLNRVSSPRTQKPPGFGAQWTFQPPDATSRQLEAGRCPGRRKPSDRAELNWLRCPVWPLPRGSKASSKRTAASSGRCPSNCVEGGSAGRTSRPRTPRRRPPLRPPSCTWRPDRSIPTGEAQRIPCRPGPSEDVRAAIGA